MIQRIFKALGSEISLLGKEWTCLLSGDSIKRDNIAVRRLISRQIGLGKTRSYWKIVDKRYQALVPKVAAYVEQNNVRHIESNALFTKDVFERVVKKHHKRFSSYQEAAPDLTWVMSTGRCGTLALHKFITSSSEVFAVHRNFPEHERFYQHGTALDTKSFVFAKCFNADITDDQALAIVEEYLAKRWQTITRANNKRLIFCAHHDVAWMPVISALFPKSRFIHLIRNPQTTIQSFLSKNQYTATQILPLASSSNRELLFRDLFAMVCWYYVFVNLYIRAHGTSLSRERFLFLKSEDFFKVDNLVYQNLSKFLDLEVSYENFETLYSHRTNSKEASKGSMFPEVKDWPDGIKNVYNNFTRPFLPYL
jgi:Sulfotransferase family